MPPKVFADQVINLADGSKRTRTLADLQFDIKKLSRRPSDERLDCPKVPKSLLPSDGHRNEPKVMSLGPYHHGNPKLAHGERIKLKLAIRVFKLFRRPEGQLLEDAVNTLHREISLQVDELRRCYEWKSTQNYPNDEFVVMMMVDGCALLWYMFFTCNEDEHVPENFRIRNEDVSHLHRDALLLENQLPYQFLLKLRNRLPEYDRSGWMALCLDFFGMFEKEAKAEACSFPQKMREFCSSPFPTIGQVINCCIPQIINRRRRPNPDVELQTIGQVINCCIPQIINRRRRPNPDVESQTIGQVINCCIPQIIYRRLRPNPDVESQTDPEQTNPDVESQTNPEQTNPDVESQTNPDVESQTNPEQTNPDVESQTNPEQTNPDVESQTDRAEESQATHLLDLYLQHFLGARRPSQDFIGGMGPLGDVKEQVMASFRNVKELMAAGIRIKPSPTRYLRDISFTSNVITGCLRLPIITIDNSTKDMFFNLIAWEISQITQRDFISYLRFLDSLIDHADDVKELQSAGVLQNHLGTHEEVAEFFNTVSAKFVSNSLAYRDVRVKIRKHLKSHRNSKLKRWMTQCLDTYFGSPWTIIAWVGAALALFFTAVQTYFSAFSH